MSILLLELTVMTPLGWLCYQNGKLIMKDENGLSQ